MSLSIKTLGIIGTGAMGRGIAQVAAEAGLRVRLHNTRPGAVTEARAYIERIWARGVEKQRLTRAQAADYAMHLHEANNLENLTDCQLVIEAIVEDLAVKQALFQSLEQVLPESTILATNTSSLSVTAIASACRQPQRVIGFHFFNPAPLMKIVEVIPGLLTAPDVIDTVDALGQRLGHFTARTTDTPGFLVNHAGRAYGTEALRILGEGIANIATIDRVLTEQGGFRMGPFALMDLTGIDISHTVMESIYHQYYQEPRYRPSPITRQQLDAGLLGRKTGKGFYSHEDGHQQVVSEPATLAEATPRPVWISPEAAEAQRSLTMLVKAAGWPLEEGEQPSDEALSDLKETPPCKTTLSTTVCAHFLAAIEVAWRQYGSILMALHINARQGIRPHFYPA